MAPASSKRDPEIFLAQRLASNEKSTRTKALKTLRKYISLRSQKVEGGFSSADLLKIWKGLFYCLWMQDKPLLQEELSDQISRLMHSFCTTDSQLLYFETFLQTLKREWNGIDRLRMDKFFQLVRFVFRQAFEMLKRREWETSMVNHFSERFMAQLFQSKDGVPDGLVLHILDVYMTELAKIGSSELTADQNLTLIDPFCKTMAKTKDRLLVTSISKHIFSTIVDQAPFAIEDLMKELYQGADSDSLKASDDEEETFDQSDLKMSRRANKVNGVQEKNNQDRQGETPDMEDVHPHEDSDSEDAEHVLQFDYAAIADRLFELGSHKNTPNFNRTRMYSMVKIFRDLSEGVFPQNEDEDGDKLDSSDDELFNKKKNKQKRKKEKKDEEGTFGKKQKSCEVVGNPRAASQTTGSCTSEGENEDKLQAQDNKPGLQRHVKANIIKYKKSKGKSLKLDIMEVGEEAAPESFLISKDMHKELGGDEGLKNHPVLRTVLEGSGENEQTAVLSGNGKKSKKKYKKSQARKPTFECANDVSENIQRLEDLDDLAPLKKKKNKSVSADERSSTSCTAGKTCREAKAPKKRCADKRPEDPSGTFPVEMTLSEDKTRDDACMPGKKKKRIIEMRADAKITNTLLEKIQTECISSNTPAAEVITTEQHSSHHTAPFLMKKNKKQKSKGKTRETRNYGDVDMTPDCTKIKMNYIGAEKADAVELSEVKSLKKEKQKRVSSEQQGLEVEVRETEEPLRTVQSSCRPLKKKVQKRKMQLAECLTGERDSQSAQDTRRTMEHQDADLSFTALPNKKLKMKTSKAAAGLISFQGETTPPTPLYCKTKPKGPGTPLSISKVFHTPQSETKKVTFGLKNNKTTEFRKTDLSLLVSPVGSSRVAFDPKKIPVSSVLKSPTLSSTVSVKKAVFKRRPTAADFF
ncbi:uncharacterized protein rrp1 [Brachyhypopomus gauderio]|uniref:uncharacterized protein rrp1 n=1 Tax=Brachyhypopomus gauderio TaxID=698409 RepID=UPI0040438953